MLKLKNERYIMLILMKKALAIASAFCVIWGSFVLAIHCFDFAGVACADNWATNFEGVGQFACFHCKRF